MAIEHRKTDDEPKDDDLLVLDPTARIRYGEPDDLHKNFRHHTVGEPARTFTFEPNKPTRLPYDYGMKFLQDGFKVMDLEGKVILPPPVSPIDGSLADVKLASDEVIANLTELSVDSLLNRCKMLPGSADLNRKSGKQVLVAFLIAARHAKQADAKLSDETGDTEEGNAASVDQLTGGMQYPVDPKNIVKKPPQPETTSAA